MRAGELYRGVPQLAEAYERSFEGLGLRQDGSPRAEPAGAETAPLALFTTADRTPNKQEFLAFISLCKTD